MIGKRGWKRKGIWRKLCDANSNPEQRFTMEQIRTVFDVFTPTTPAKITFVERESINSRLVNALRTPGKQIVVYGHSGSGKTTLLENKLHQLYEGHVSTKCMKGMTFEQIVLDAFDQLAPYYCAEVQSTKARQIGGQMSIEYAAIKTTIASNLTDTSTDKRVRYLPPQLTPQALGKLIGAAKCGWVLEDFHKIDPQEKQKLSQLMKVFMDLSDSYRELKVIAIGAVNTARQVVEYDSELSNRVAEISVPLMSTEEVDEIISKGETSLNIKFSPTVRKGIASYSNGLAAVCHQICLNMCLAAGVESRSNLPVTLGDKSFNDAIRTYIEEASDTLKSTFEKAFRQRKSGSRENAKLILEALAELPIEGATNAEILRKIKRKVPDYPDGNVAYFTNRLQTEAYGEVVVFDSSSERYFFANPIYRAFIQAYIHNKKSSEVSGRINKVIQENIDSEQFFRKVIEMVELLQKKNK